MLFARHQKAVTRSTERSCERIFGHRRHDDKMEM